MTMLPSLGDQQHPVISMLSANGLPGGMTKFTNSADSGGVRGNLPDVPPDL
jgi:hypothetical protein